MTACESGYPAYGREISVANHTWPGLQVSAAKPFAVRDERLVAFAVPPRGFEPGWPPHQHQHQHPRGHEGGGGGPRSEYMAWEREWECSNKDLSHQRAAEPGSCLTAT